MTSELLSSPLCWTRKRCHPMAWWGEYVSHQQFTLHAWRTVVLLLRLLTGANVKRNWSQDVCEVVGFDVEKGKCSVKKTSLASVRSKKLNSWNCLKLEVDWAQWLLSVILWRLHKNPPRPNGKSTLGWFGLVKCQSDEQMWDAGGFSFYRTVNQMNCRHQTTKIHLRMSPTGWCSDWGHHGAITADPLDFSFVFDNFMQNE